MADAGHGANGLAHSAVVAVERIAHAAGKPIDVGTIPPASPRATSGSPLDPVVAGVAAAAAVVAVGLGLRWLRTVTQARRRPSATIHRPDS